MCQWGTSLHYCVWRGTMLGWFVWSPYCANMHGEAYCVIIPLQTYDYTMYLVKPVTHIALARNCWIVTSAGQGWAIMEVSTP